jgi:hypothetical protein
VLGPETGSAVLLGRLVQEGRRPLAVLRAYPGRWPGLNGTHVLAVTEGLLWLAVPRLLGEPAVASIEVSSVTHVSMRGPGSTALGRRSDAVRVHLDVGHRALKYTAADGLTVCQDFVAALRSQGVPT